MKSLLTPDINWQTVEWNLDLTQIHIFKINVPEKFRDISASYKSVLSDLEISKAEKYVQLNDKERFITSKYFLRLILSKFINIMPVDVKFDFQNNKKPQLNGIEFNVSHSGSIILIAVSNKAIGIDVEFTDKFFNFESILEVCFHADEKENLVRTHKNTFYTIWTRKEALLKATGEGLVDNLETINTLTNSIKRSDKFYELKSFFVQRDYIASIAYQSTEENHFKFWQF
ncbi:4'-phosphopantetheinyl transferase superfamily protein [Pedobacter aquatilis]|uniref:4'-phosphopantetheinyl transferase family protein n=1 Tax=Pedobacter aquatilis TaxID=351343 RepID=UPI0025B5AEFD|nr:4'-phosphopantetheinyl transferase superfamily protein [Pedobacter aquatilis]MDN3585374.1 4'-phosphopantetheinyl transferase superfamily protein [Pedobacter aquatilis]